MSADSNRIGRQTQSVETSTTADQRMTFAGTLARVDVPLGRHW